MPSYPQHPLGIKGMFTASFRLYKETFSKLFSFTLPKTVWLIGAVIFSYYLLFKLPIYDKTEVQVPFLMVIIAIFFDMFYVETTCAMNSIVKGEALPKTPWYKSWRSFHPKYSQVVNPKYSANLRTLLVFLAIVVPGVYVAEKLNLDVNLLSCLGICVLVLPAVYIGVKYSLVVPVALIEAKEKKGALKSSWSLVRGRWWKTFLVLVLPGFLVLWGLPIVFIEIPYLLGVHSLLLARSFVCILIVFFLHLWVSALHLIYYKAII